MVRIWCQRGKGIFLQLQCQDCEPGSGFILKAALRTPRGTFIYAEEPNVAGHNANHITSLCAAGWL